MPALSLRLVPPEFAICRLPPDSPVPAWADSPVFSSVTRTAHERSVLCPAGRQLQCDGPWNFNAVGIMAAITAPLADAGISLLAVATFDTDYVLVKADQLARRSGCSAKPATPSFWTDAAPV